MPQNPMSNSAILAQAKTVRKIINTPALFESAVQFLATDEKFGAIRPNAQQFVLSMLVWRETQSLDGEFSQGRLEYAKKEVVKNFDLISQDEGFMQVISALD